MNRVPTEEYSHIQQPPGLEQVWKDNKFLVQIYKKENGVTRLSIRTIDGSDGISWDELNLIKLKVGFGNFDAVEVYPRQRDIVNVANMRHLWVLDKPIPFAWRKK